MKSLVAAAKETPSITADEIEEARDEVCPLGHFPGRSREYYVQCGCLRRFSLWISVIWGVFVSVFSGVFNGVLIGS